MVPDFETPGDERTAVALRAAHLYYIQDLTMEAIAGELFTSRSSVSRLLSYARATGLVDIQIRSPLNAASRIAGELSEKFHITAHVVPVAGQASDLDRLERVALSAARTLGEFFDSNMTMGIAWGSTLNAVSRYVTPKPTHNSHIVQLNGAGNLRTSGVDYASQILGRFGEAFGARVHQLPVPAFFDDPDTKRAYWKERSIGRILEMQASMDVALFGLGTPFSEVPSHVYAGGYLDDDDYALLAESHVVGDVATVFFRADGSVDDIALNQRTTGPDFTVLRRTPRRICVVSGLSKVEGLRGALAAGLITDLFLDDSTAQTLLESQG